MTAQPISYICGLCLCAVGVALCYVPRLAAAGLAMTVAGAGIVVRSGT